MKSLLLGLLLILGIATAVVAETNYSIGVAGGSPVVRVQVDGLSFDTQFSQQNASTGAQTTAWAAALSHKILFGLSGGILVSGATVTGAAAANTNNMNAFLEYEIFVTQKVSASGRLFLVGNATTSTALVSTTTTTYLTGDTGLRVYF